MQDDSYLNIFIKDAYSFQSKRCYSSTYLVLLIILISINIHYIIFTIYI